MVLKKNIFLLIIPMFMMGCSSLITRNDLNQCIEKCQSQDCIEKISKQDDLLTCECKKK